MAMGFSRERARDALDACYDSVEEAILLLLASDGPDAPSPVNRAAPAAIYSHKAPDGTWHRYNVYQNAQISSAVERSPLMLSSHAYAGVAELWRALLTEAAAMEARRSGG